jgi:hypothetical protein
MRGIKPSVALATVGTIGLALAASGFVDRSGGLMASAANRFLASLDDEAKARASFSYDSPERLNWHFIPRERKGLPFKAMGQASRELAFGLIQTGLSHEGFLKATTIMSLEQILLELEKGSGPVRDPENYFLTVFGEPSDRGKWGWRVEGHHLSLNFVVENGKILSATPAFFGSNPAEVTTGSRKGLRNLADLEDRALRLLQALDDNQKKTAIIAENAPNDVRAANKPQPPTDAAEGIAFAQLNEAQKPMLRALIESYAAQMPSEVGQAWLDEIERAGVEHVKFAWAGATERHQRHHYKMQGPTFLVEFNNTQNGGDKVPANHIHSVWRNMLGDFGIPMGSK